MSGSRDIVLGRIRQALGRTNGLEADMRNRLAARLRSRPRGLIPKRARGDGAALAEDFKTRAEQAGATVGAVAGLADVPAALAAYLSVHTLPTEIRAAPHPDLTDINWSVCPMLGVTYGPTEGDDAVSLTRAFAGIAETGTLMLLAGPEGPTTLNFLPETHVVVLKTPEVVGAHEDAWDRLRDAIGPEGLLRRAVNLITGPSRTGDIEQTIELGAQGPLRLHILLVADDA